MSDKQEKLPHEAGGWKEEATVLKNPNSALFRYMGVLSIKDSDGIVRYKMQPGTWSGMRFTPKKGALHIDHVRAQDAARWTLVYTPEADTPPAPEGIPDTGSDGPLFPLGHKLTQGEKAFEVVGLYQDIRILQPVHNKGNYKPTGDPAFPILLENLIEERYPAPDDAWSQTFLTLTNFLQAQLAEREDEIKRLERLAGERGDWKAAFAAKKAAHENGDADLKKQLTATQALLDKVQAEKTALRQRCDGLEAALETKDKRIVELTESNTRLIAENKQQSRKLQETVAGMGHTTKPDNLIEFNFLEDAKPDDLSKARAGNWEIYQITPVLDGKVIRPFVVLQRPAAGDISDTLLESRTEVYEAGVEAFTENKRPAPNAIIGKVNDV